LPEAPPEDFPFDGPPPDNFEVPPETVGAEDAVTKKMLRCNRISAPVLVSTIVHAISGHVYYIQSNIDFI
jgi:hypothetical protein